MQRTHVSCPTQRRPPHAHVRCLGSFAERRTTRVVPNPIAIVLAIPLAFAFTACAARGPATYHAEPVAWIHPDELLVVVSQDLPRWTFAITKSEGPHRERTTRTHERWLRVPLDGRACLWTDESTHDPSAAHRGTLAAGSPPRVVDRLDRSHVLPDHVELLERMHATCPHLQVDLGDTIRHDPDTPLILHVRGGFVQTIFDRRTDRCVDVQDDPVLGRARRFYEGVKPETLLMQTSHEASIGLWHLPLDTLIPIAHSAHRAPRRERWPDHELGDLRLRVWHAAGGDAAESAPAAVGVLQRTHVVTVTVIRSGDVIPVPVVQSSGPQRADAWPLLCSAGAVPPTEGPPVP